MCERLVPQAIASPLADEKLTKKLHKLVKKASAAKALRRGVKEVVKAVRKGASGLCIIAGDISPVDARAPRARTPPLELTGRRSTSEESTASRSSRVRYERSDGRVRSRKSRSPTWKARLEK